MALKEYKPMTSGLRGRIDVLKTEITCDKPEKSLTTGKKSNAGRDTFGRISVRGQGGGHKRRYRKIDLRETNTEYQVPFILLNTTQTVVQILRWCSMQMAKNDTSWHRRVCELDKT